MKIAAGLLVVVWVINAGLSAIFMMPMHMIMSLFVALFFSACYVVVE